MQDNGLENSDTILYDPNHYCSEHPLVFLLHHDMSNQRDRFVRESRMDFDFMNDCILECGEALLSRDQTGYSRIEHETRDALGFTPADYAACSAHTELGVQVIMDRIHYDLKRGRALFVPDFFLTSLLYYDEEIFAQKASDVMDNVLPRIKSLAVEEEESLSLYSGAALNKKIIGIASLWRNVLHWEQAGCDLDGIAAGNLSPEDDEALSNLRKSYLHTRGYRADDTALHADALGFVKLVNKMRQQRRRLT